MALSQTVEVRAPANGDAKWVVGSAIIAAALTVVLVGAAADLSSRLFPHAFDDSPGALVGVLEVLFLYYYVGLIFPFFFFVFLAGRPKGRTSAQSSFPRVSIVIPAFNEEQVVAKAVQAALAQNYPDFEVIVVDDGSRDFTRFDANARRVRVLSQKSNRGKAAAVNLGISSSVGSIILVSDSDSVLRPDALRHLVPHFADPRVGAVAGAVSVWRPRRWLESLQDVEYTYGQCLVKSAQVNCGGSVTVCPGPITAFRRAALQRVGLLSNRTFTEDFDVTLSLIAAGYIAAFEADAISDSHAPRTWSDLGKQRLRWYRGAVQVFSEHHDLFFARAAGWIGGLWLPYLLFSGFGSIVIEVVLIGLILMAVLMGALPGQLLLTGLFFILVAEALVAFQHIGVLAVAGALRRRTFVACLLMKPFYLFLGWIRLRALVRQARGTIQTW